MPQRSRGGWLKLSLEMSPEWPAPKIASAEEVLCILLRKWEDEGECAALSVGLTDV